VVLRRKFRPPTTAPNPLPPIKDGECRPNVFNIGPGNCYHTPDSGGTYIVCIIVFTRARQDALVMIAAW